MILFAQDVIKSKPHIHLETRNKSFIRMAILLRKKGVINNKFFLSLYNRDLINVDPFDPNLDPITRAKVRIEATVNPWYFFRECIGVPTVGGDLSLFELNRSNLAMIWFHLNSINTGLVQSRQTGKTFVVLCICAWIMFVMGRRSIIGMFTKDATLVNQNVEKLKSIKDGLPPYFVTKSAKDSDRKEGITYDANKTQYVTFTASTDEKGALKLGRGVSITNIHYDELPYIKYNYLTVPTANASRGAVAEQAAKAGVPSSIFYTTTAGNPETKEGMYALDMFEAACRFTEKLYDARDIEDLKDTINRNGTNHMVFMEFNHRQVGKSDEWLEKMRVENNSDPDQFARDYLNIWQVSTSHAVIPPELMLKIRHSYKEPEYTDTDKKIMIHWYADAHQIEQEWFINKPMLLGMDSSENVGRDYTSFVLSDLADLRTLATMKCNNNNIIDVAQQVVELLVKYPNMLFIPERKSTGGPIIDLVIAGLLEHGLNPFKRIYNRIIQDRDEEQFKNINIYDAQSCSHGVIRKYFGYVTTGAARNHLYKVTLFKALNMMHSRVFDRTIITELSSLSSRNGRIDHQINGHDDSVIALMLNCHVAFFGKNLNLYGINSEDVLSHVTEDGEKVATDVRERQIAMKQRKNELDIILQSDRIDPIIRTRYEKELRYLNSQIDEKLLPVSTDSITKMEHAKKDAYPYHTNLNKIRNIFNTWRQ